MSHQPTQSLDKFFSSKIRFHMVDREGEQRSSAWFVRESNSSLYVAVSTLSASLKLSFHPADEADDGLDTQFGTPRAYFESKRRQGVTGPFPFFRWRRAKPHPKECRRIARLVFPTEGLKAPYVGARSKKPQIAFQLPPVGQAVEVGIFSSLGIPMEQEAELQAHGGYTAICRVDVGNESMSIAARTVPFDISCIPVDRQPQSITWLDDAAKGGEGLEDLRAILIQSAPKDGDEIVLTEVGGLRLDLN